MKRPLFVLCLTIVLSIALYLKIYPPADFSYGEAVGEKIYLTGLVYAKEFQKGQDAPVLILYLKPEELRFQEQKIPFYYNFIVILSENSIEPAIGARVIVTGILKEYEEATNPGEFDARAYYKTMGISARITDCKVIATDKNSNQIKEKLWQFRCVLGSILEEVFDEATAAFLKGMLLGDKSTMTTEQKTLYREAGILHILAISGLHISLLGLGLYRCMRRVYIPEVAAAMGCCLVMLLYGIMVGMPVSALRAISMLVLRMLAKCTGRTYDMQTALMVCCVGILLENPLYLYHAGFLLSFSAVLGVCVLKPALLEEKKPMSKLADSMLTSFSVTIFTLPIQLFFYYEVSVYALLWNLLIIPLAGVCLISGVLSILSYGVAMYPAQVFSLGAKGVIWFYEKGSQIIQSLPQNMWCPGKPKEWQIFSFSLILGVILHLKKLHFKYKVGLLCGAVLLFNVNSRNGLEVNVLDVGQGDCICMQLPDGTTWLYDGGSSDSGEVGKYQIIPFLKHEGITVLEAVFVSHADTDHVSGIKELLQCKNIQIKLLVLPCTEKGQQGKSTEIFGKETTEKSELSEILSLAYGREIPILWLEEGMCWKAEEIKAQCLHPAADFVTEDRNQASAVVYINYGNFSMLLTGDIGGAGEEALVQELEKQKIQEVTLLKVAHHGSKYSGEEILKQVTPEFAVISCGKNNWYGHPHKETLDRLKEAGCKIWNTAEGGQIVIEVPEKKGMDKEPIKLYYWKASEE